MFISFIVPVYNVAPYLEQCIDSLICQDSDDYEIILVDDGSTDNSRETCDRYAEKTDKIKVIHKSNGGLLSARNAGIKEATGDYLAFVDGDDYLEKNCLATIMQTVMAQNNPQIVFMKAYKVYPGGKKELLDEEYDPAKIINQNRSAVQEYIASLKKYPGSACTKIISRDFLLSNNLKFDEGRLCEDLKFVMCMLLSADSFGYYKGDYYYYRQKREGSITNSISFKNYNDRIKTCDEWSETVHNSSDYSEKKLLNSALAYEYKIMLLDAKKLEGNNAKTAFDWLKKNETVLNFRNDIQIKLIRACVNMFGVEITSSLLHIFIHFQK